MASAARSLKPPVTVSAPQPPQPEQLAGKVDFPTVSLDMIEKLAEPQFAPLVKQMSETGFFYLQIPEECASLIPHAQAFANAFYQDDALKEKKLSGWSGYHDRNDEKGKYQVESFYCEDTLWEGVYPPQVGKLGKSMRKCALEVLSAFVNSLGLTEEVSSYLLPENPMTHLSFNHYRSHLGLPGLPKHKDFGLITLLYIDKPGLEVWVHDRFEPLPPKEGHFVVNFGQVFEMLFNEDKRVVAAEHHVCQVSDDRISFGIFIDPARESPMCQLREGKLEAVISDAEKHIDDGFKETYGADDE